MKRHDIELMAPAGSYESLRAAIEAGADSVYFGAGALNMRSASSANFTADDLGGIVAITRAAGVKCYLTVNTVIYDDDMEAMRAIVDAACREGVDAVIVSDQAAMLYARSRGMEVHISTQLNVSNIETVAFYAQWADVMVLARELTLERIKYISDEIVRRDIRGPRGELVKIEMFAHGALCMAVSGKCYLSLHDCGLSANRGACRQLCRRSYELRDSETGAEIRTEGPYLLSPKDLCTVDFLDRFVGAGVRVLKIEGRARPGDYVKRVVECYDEALEALAAGSFTPELGGALRERLATVFNRGFWGGYYLGAPVVELSARYGSSATTRRVFVGRVTNVFKRVSVAQIHVEAAPFERGAGYVITGATTGVLEGTAAELFVDDRPVDMALQGCDCSLKVARPVHRGDRLYKVVPADGLGE